MSKSVFIFSIMAYLFEKFQKLNFKRKYKRFEKTFIIVPQLNI